MGGLNGKWLSAFICGVFCLERHAAVWRRNLEGDFMNWLYLLSGGMALYSVESADINQPFHITAMVALAVCLLPVTLDTYLT